MAGRNCGKAALMLVALSAVGVMGARVRPGGDPRPDRIIWADPFDNYSQWAWDNRDNPQYAPRGTLWEGGPVPAGSPTATYPRKSDNAFANPDSGCGVTRQTSPSPHELGRQQWVINDCGTITTSTGLRVVPSHFYAGPDDFTSEDCTRGGWVETIAEFGRLDCVWQNVSGYYSSLGILTRDLTPRIQSFSPLRAWDDPDPNAVQGSDEHPLTLIFDLHDSGKPNNPRAWVNSSYVELNLNDEHAPTDYIWRGDRDMNYESGDPECCPWGPYPIICQQVREVNVGNYEQAHDLQYLNDHCPSLVPPYDPQTGTGKTWPAIAFGFLAVACKDPCTCAEQGSGSHRPTMNHPMLFDGNVWRELRSGRGTALTECPPSWVASPPEIAGYEASMQDSGGGSCGNFALGGGTHRVYLKLTTDRILIWMMTRNMDGSQNHYCGAFDRVYKGPFNRVAFGVGPGCELQDKMVDGDSYTCKEGGTPKQCLTYTSDRAAGTTLNYTDGYWRAQVDSMSLLDGQLVHHTFEGACCKTDGTCEVMLDADCIAAGGSFSGPGTVCDADACTGACCQPRGLCTHTTVDACPGSFLGIGTTCTGGRQCCPTPFADWDLDQDVDMTDFGGLQECLTLGGGAIQPGCICFDHNRDNVIDETDMIAFIECATGPAVVPGSVPPACVP